MEQATRAIALDKKTPSFPGLYIAKPMDISRYTLSRNPRPNTPFFPLIITTMPLLFLCTFPDIVLRPVKDI